MIDLTECNDKCFADAFGNCTVLARDIPETCNSNCPFYKPQGCNDWVRVEEFEGVWLYSPEEYERSFKDETTDHKQSELYWRIKRVPVSKKRF